MSVIPCRQNAQLRQQITRFAEILKTEAHALGDHGLDEKDFYNSGLFRGAIERVRGQFSAAMRGKKEFVRHVLNYLQDNGHVASWDSTEAANRNDYRITLSSGKTAVIDLKGCLDGNNTNIFERPADADEFVIWSMCTNRGADPRRNAWSGIHTRLSAEIITTGKRVDGLVIWDMVCATLGRPCPKVTAEPNRLIDLGPYRVPPVCIYVFPATIPTAQPNEDTSLAQALTSVELLHAFHASFGGRDDEVNYVDFGAAEAGGETLRRTVIRRGNAVEEQSEMTPIRRT